MKVKKRERTIYVHFQFTDNNTVAKAPCQI